MKGVLKILEILAPWKRCHKYSLYCSPKLVPETASMRPRQLGVKETGPMYYQDERYKRGMSETRNIDMGMKDT
jgi:hypothetical protein